jgi:hypothetical protein
MKDADKIRIRLQAMLDWFNDGEDITDITYLIPPLVELASTAVDALDTIGNNGEGRGPGWTPAQTARIALSMIRESTRAVEQKHNLYSQEHF